MFDFILFEHSGLKNHFVDLQAIGNLLKDCGYKVAYANVTEEGSYISVKENQFVPLSTCTSAFTSKKAYLKAVFEELSPLTRNFYAGSILSDTNLSFLKYVPSGKKVFMWALRSFFFSQYKRPSLSRYYPMQFYNSIYNAWLTKRQKNIYFFVSDDIIRDEFVDLGYDSGRFVIRQERTCTHLVETKMSYHPTKFLSIGALRPEKRIDLCMKAMNELPEDTFNYVIAGRAYNIHGYDVKLEKMAKKYSFVSRISKRLNDDEYNSLINDCDYLILTDEKQPSCVTNGTMAEALLAGKPIIAPNYNPYKTIVDKYNVGFLYEMHNHESLKRTIQKAIETPNTSFTTGIRSYQESLLIDSIIENFGKDIDRVINV